MKPIVFNDGEGNVEVALTLSKQCIRITDDNTDVFVLKEGLDKLIEALQQVKKEINNV